MAYLGPSIFVKEVNSSNFLSKTYICMTAPVTENALICIITYPPTHRLGFSLTCLIVLFVFLNKLMMMMMIFLWGRSPKVCVWEL